MSNAYDNISRQPKLPYAHPVKANIYSRLGEVREVPSDYQLKHVGTVRPREYLAPRFSNYEGGINKAIQDAKAYSLANNMGWDKDYDTKIPIFQYDSPSAFKKIQDRIMSFSPQGSALGTLPKLSSGRVNKSPLRTMQSQEVFDHNRPASYVRTKRANGGDGHPLGSYSSAYNYITIAGPTITGLNPHNPDPVEWARNIFKGEAGLRSTLRPFDSEFGKNTVVAHELGHGVEDAGRKLNELGLYRAYENAKTPEQKKLAAKRLNNFRAEKKRYIDEYAAPNKSKSGYYYFKPVENIELMKEIKSRYIQDKNLFPSGFKGPFNQEDAARAIDKFENDSSNPYYQGRQHMYKGDPIGFDKEWKQYKKEMIKRMPAFVQTNRAIKEMNA